MQNKLHAMLVIYRLPVILLVCICLATAPVHALTLADAIELALNNDSTFLAAKANAEVSRARSSQAFARLMPQLTASANTNNNRRDYTLLNSKVSTVPEHYNSYGTQVNLTQPLLHVEKYLALSQADLLVDQADYQLAAVGNDLFVRLSQAWLDIRQARDAVTASDSKFLASQKELALARLAAENGVVSMTDLKVAQTRYAQAESEQVTAQAEQLSRLATLEQIIGVADVPVQVILSERFVSSKPVQSEQWINRAETASPAILAARCALDAAKQEVNKQRSGHLPTVELVASYNNSMQGSGIIGGQNGFNHTVHSVGVQLNLPLFSGGEQSAKTSEALALRDKAGHELEAARRTTHLKIKQAWLAWKVGFARQQSGEQAINSAINAVRSVEAQRAYGIKADLDVLQAQQQLDEMRRDTSKARNEVILSHLKLMAEAGQLTGSDVLDMEETKQSLIQK